MAAKVVLRSVFVRPSGRRIPSNRLIRTSKPPGGSALAAGER